MSEKKDEKPKEQDDSESMEFNVPDEDYLKDLDILNTLEREQVEYTDEEMEEMMKMSEDDLANDDMMKMAEDDLADDDMMKMSGMDLDLDQEDSEVQKILENLDKESFIAGLEQEAKAEGMFDLPEPDKPRPSGGKITEKMKETFEVPAEDSNLMGNETISMAAFDIDTDTGLDLDKRSTDPSIAVPESFKESEDNMEFGDMNVLIDKEFTMETEESSLETEEGSLEMESSPRLDEVDMLIDKELTTTGGKEGASELEGGPQLDEVDMLLEKESALEMTGASLGVEEGSLLSGADMLVESRSDMVKDEASLGTRETMPIEVPVEGLEETHTVEVEEVSSSEVKEDFPTGKPDQEMGKELVRETEESAAEALGVMALGPSTLTENLAEEEISRGSRLLDLDRAAAEVKEEESMVETFDDPDMPYGIQRQIMEAKAAGVGESREMDNAVSEERPTPAVPEIEPRTSDVVLRLSDLRLVRFNDLIKQAQTLQGYIKKLMENQGQVKEKIYKKLLSEYQDRRANIFKDVDFIQMQQHSKEDLDDSILKKSEFDLKLDELKDDLEEINVRYLVGEYDEAILREKEEQKKNEIESWSDRISKVAHTISTYQNLLTAEGLSGKSLLEEMLSFAERKVEEKVKQVEQKEEATDLDKILAMGSYSVTSSDSLPTEEEMEEIDLSSSSSILSMITCDRCGKQTPANERFCTKCGAKLKR
jgi:hypothetical protein